MSFPRVALFSASTGVQAGGAEAYTFATARGLRDAGVPVTVIHGKGAECPCAAMGAAHATGRVLSRDGGLSRLLRRLGVYRLTRTSPYDLEVLSRGLFSGHRLNLLADFDVIEVQYSTEALFFRFANPAALKILHLHGPSMPRWLPRLCRATGTAPDLVLTCSEWSRKQLIARGVPWPIEVNFNGIDEQLFHPAEIRAETSPKLRIGFVGRLSKYKGLQTIERTAALLGPEFEFHIVGSPEGGYDPPSAPNLFYRGVMNSPQVADFLREMDCFYFPSLSESFGIAAAEAMSTGLPVVASDVGGLPEIIRDGQNGYLVPTEDAHLAAERLRQLRANPELRRTLGRAARATVLDRFTTTHTARRFLELHDRWSAMRGQAHAGLATAEVLP
jgi:glycosyltransferase involved in cell wall biosynthesis